MNTTINRKLVWLVFAALVLAPTTLSHCLKHVCVTPQTKTVTKTVTKTMTLYIQTQPSPSSPAPLSPPSPAPPILPSPPSPSLFKVTQGNSGTLTYFTDTTTQCYGEAIPPGDALAINPLLLGFTTDDWNNLYADAQPGDIPWCGKRMSITARGITFTGTIIDTCDPVGSPFPDPNTGQLIGLKCDYTDAIDVYGQNGLDFLQSLNGDDFYQGPLQWKLI
jgi:hypothetical protein